MMAEKDKIVLVLMIAFALTAVPLGGYVGAYLSRWESTSTGVASSKKGCRPTLSSDTTPKTG